MKQLVKPPQSLKAQQRSSRWLVTLPPREAQGEKWKTSGRSDSRGQSLGSARPGHGAPDQCKEKVWLGGGARDLLPGAPLCRGQQVWAEAGQLQPLWAVSDAHITGL